MKREALLLPGAALAVGLALAAGAPVALNIEGMQFPLASVTVERGSTVTWTNKDVVPHTVTAPGKFDSGNIAPGKSFSQRMDQPGQIDYVCTYHPGMKGKVVVK